MKIWVDRLGNLKTSGRNSGTWKLGPGGKIYSVIWHNDKNPNFSALRFSDITNSSRNVLNTIFSRRLSLQKSS